MYLWIREPTGAGASGRPEEFHLQSPTEPYVNLSIHTAPASLAIDVFLWNICPYCLLHLPLPIKGRTIYSMSFGSLNNTVRLMLPCPA